jgi:hypothetical protein
MSLNCGSSRSLEEFAVGATHLLGAHARLVWEGMPATELADRKAARFFSLVH